MISVLSTLRETFELWGRHYRYFVPIAVFLGIPFILFAYLPDEVTDPLLRNPDPEQMWRWLIIMPLTLVTFIFQTVMDAVAAAAILGVLKAQPPEKPVWESARDNVRTYTWTLFRMMLILMLIGMAVGLVFACFSGMLISCSVSSDPPSRPPSGLASALGFVSVFGIAIFILFLKYALADPIIVLEHRGAQDALLQSWDMTKGFFGYVFCCYVFLGLGNWLIQWLLQALADRVPALDFPIQVFFTVLNSIWVVLAWVMYFRIKAAGDPRPAENFRPLN